jgi:integrase/recombinase XerC
MVLVEDFIKYLRYEKNYSTHTVLAYEHDLKVFFEFVETQYFAAEPSQISSEMVRSWVVGLMKNNMTSRTVARKLSSLTRYTASPIQKSENRCRFFLRLLRCRLC